MNYQRDQVISLTNKLQQQTDVPLWSIADEGLIYAIAKNNKVVWGKNTKKIRKVICVAMKSKLVGCTLFFIGSVKAILIWNAVRKHKITKKNKFEKIFAGFGASSEWHLYEEFKKNTVEPHLYINWVNFSNLNQIGCPTLFQIISIVYQNAFGHFSKLKKAIPEMRSYASDFLTVCAKNIGLYSFFCAYWKMAKLREIKEVTFLVPDMPAYASIEIGIKTVFTQHGLFGLSILMPKFDRINVMTEIERLYFKKLFPTIEICKTERVVNAACDKKNIAIILSPNTFLEERVQAINSFVQWAKSNEIKIVIRPTNKVTNEEISVLKDRFPDSTIDDIRTSIYDCLEMWQPKFVAAWTSTSLAIAIELGYLPISFYDPLDQGVGWSMVYPLRERVLFWPRDQGEIERAAESEQAYLVQVNLLQQNVISDKKDLVFN